jgi:hypothetical protein
MRVVSKQQENVYAYEPHSDTALELIKWGCRFRMKDGKLSRSGSLAAASKKGDRSSGDIPGRRAWFHQRAFTDKYGPAADYGPRGYVHPRPLKQDNRVVGAIGIDCRLQVLRHPVETDGATGIPGAAQSNYG